MEDEIEIPAYMSYPHFVMGNNEATPRVTLPLDYSELLPSFVERKGIDKIERFVDWVNSQIYNSSFMKADPKFIRTQWAENQRGLLKSIQIGVHGGLDLLDTSLEPVEYTPHNLGGLNGVYLSVVAQQYINELLRGRN